MPKDRLTANREYLEKKIMKDTRDANIDIEEVQVKKIAGADGYEVIVTIDDQEETLNYKIPGPDLLRANGSQLDRMAQEIVRELQK